MINLSHSPAKVATRHASSASGFTFVEMLVAMSLSAMFIGTAALALSAITQNGKQFSTIYEISLGTTVCDNFYGINSSTVRTPASPNLGRLAFVHEMRDQFLDDLSRSESVFCLARSGLNSLRPEWLDWPYADPAVTNPTLDSPEAFRQYLANVEPTTASVFTSYRNVPPSTAPNTTIFLIAPTDQPDYLKVQAVYEIDFQTLTDPAGTYASVRRYKNGALTHYYDIFYDDGPEDFLIPSVVAFESRSRLAKNEGAAIDRFKQGPSGPFYLIWWPDPSINPLKTPTASKPTATSDPLEAYGHLAGKTGFTLVAPMFPSL
ncbi:MAG: prepilin-type N-terminal cleavage/methylation domain-containing protein [Verrucomicrobiae bacterium]|nr:prepilin-type N-terminal cleavage/methylation domain-containing protein [Verrucomicrobiae bacterium]